MILNNNNNHDHNSDTDIYTEKTQRFLEYIDSLEEERRKIQVFQRELPLCLDLVSLAIEKCRKEISCGGQSEEYTSRKRPVFEEFIPMKNMSSLSRGEEEGDICREKNITIGNNCGNDKSSLKSDWLTSVQLWKHAPNQEELAKEVAVQKNGSGGGFQREKSVGSSAKPQQAKASMTAESGGGGDGSCGGNCKRRRSWSPELHRRFVAAVEQLGGVLVATPKKIRDVMKVDGLTNNEIKSHLQKYRLHASAGTPETQNPSHVQAVPQFVVLGGLWIPPPPDQHTPTAAAATTSASREGAEATSTPPDEIYAPKAARPQPRALSLGKTTFKEKETN